MSTIRFSDVEEFGRELAHDADAVDRRIVRVTSLRRPVLGGAVNQISVVATAKVAGDLVRLEVYSGDWWGPGSSVSDAAITAAKATQARLEHIASDLGLAVRAGLLEEGAP